MENSNGGAGAAGGDNPQPTNVHQQPGLPASLIQQQQGVAQPPGLLQPPAAPGPMYYHQYQQQPAGYPSAVPFQPHQQPQGFYPAAPMMYHQGAPPTAPPVQGASWQAGPACLSPSNYPGSMFTAQAGPSTSGSSAKPWQFARGDATTSSARPGTARPKKGHFEEVMASCALCTEERSPLFALSPCGHHAYCNQCLFRSSRGTIIRCSSCRKPANERVRLHKLRRAKK